MRAGDRSGRVDRLGLRRKGLEALPDGLDKGTKHAYGNPERGAVSREELPSEDMGGPSVGKSHFTGSAERRRILLTWWMRPT